MQCPFCGSEMEKGFIYGRKDCGLLWLPSGEKLPLIITENNVKTHNGLLLGEKPFPENARLEFYICRECNTGVSRF